MDSTDSEDEFDRLLRVETIPDELLQAADLLERVASGSCFLSISPSDQGGQEADEYDSMFTDELSTDALMACDEAERIASLPNQVVDGTGSAGLGMQQLPPPTPIEYPGSFSEKPGITAVPGATESPPGISNRHTQQWDSDEFDLLLSDHLSQEVLLAYDEAQSLDFVPVLPIPSSTTLSPVTALDTSISEFEPPISTPLSSNSPSTFLPVPFSFRPLTPLRNITNCGPRIAANKLVMLGSPISISSDSSSDDSDDESSTPETSPIIIVKTSLKRSVSVSTNASFSLPIPFKSEGPRLRALKTRAPSTMTKVAPNLKRKATTLPEDCPALKKAKAQTHLESFFAGYPRFNYNPAAPVSAQYDALCRLYNWPKSERGATKSERSPREIAYAGYQLAMARTFRDIFGNDVDDLGNWQSLCRVLELDVIPQSLWGCQAAVREVHVNLVDLVDWAGTGAPIQKFDSLEDLGEYTRETRKFFPQGRAEESGLLVYLLRHILN